MKLEEFTSSPSLSGILTEEERSAIFTNFVNPHSLPIPHHLSSCKNYRGASYFSIREHGGRSALKDGIYCVRDVEEGAFISKKPFSYSSTTFTVDKEIAIEGFVLAEMVLAKYEIIFVLFILFK
jgi:hypothetical protein